MRLSGIARTVQCVGALVIFIPWQIGLQTLQETVKTCRNDTSGALACPRVWFNALDNVSLRWTLDRDDTLAATRNFVQTLNTCAVLWFLLGIVPQSRRATIAWFTGLALLFLQPAIYATSSELARPEPGYGGGLNRVLFMTAYADAPELHFLFDPTLLVVVFIARVAAPLTAIDLFGVSAWLAVRAFECMTVLYAIVLRRVEAPSVIITLMTAVAAAAWVRAPDTASTATYKNQLEFWMRPDDATDRTSPSRRWCSVHLQSPVRTATHAGTNTATVTGESVFEIGTLSDSDDPVGVNHHRRTSEGGGGGDGNGDGDTGNHGDDEDDEDDDDVDNETNKHNGTSDDDRVELVTNTLRGGK